MNNIESYLEILEKLKAILERDVKLNRDKLPPYSQVKEILIAEPNKVHVRANCHHLRRNPWAFIQLT